MPPTLLPARPTSETGPTPHHTTPHHTTPPPPPPIRVRQPPDVWKGPSLILQSEFIYPPWEHVWVNVCTDRWCTRVRGREFRNERRIYGLAGLRISLHGPLPALLQGGAPPSDFLAGIPFRSSGAGSRPSFQPRWYTGCAVRRGWLDDARIRAWCISNPGDPDVKSVHFDYLTVAKNMRVCWN